MLPYANICPPQPNTTNFTAVVSTQLKAATIHATHATIIIHKRQSCCNSRQSDVLFDWRRWPASSWNFDAHSAETLMRTSWNLAGVAAGIKLLPGQFGFWYILGTSVTFCYLLQSIWPEWQTAAETLMLNSWYLARHSTPLASNVYCRIKLTEQKTTTTIFHKKSHS